MLCLVDADPHGLQIFLNYRDGSKAMSFDNANLVAPRLQWLGVTSDDISRWSRIVDCYRVAWSDSHLAYSRMVEEDSRLPLTSHDVKKGLAMLRLPDLDPVLR